MSAIFCLYLTVNSLTLHHLKNIVNTNDNVYVLSGIAPENETEAVTAGTPPSEPSLVILGAVDRWDLILAFVVLKAFYGKFIVRYSI